MATANTRSAAASTSSGRVPEPCPSSAPSAGALIYLASFPKSGNTWARIFLANYVMGKRVGINDLWKHGFAGGDLRPDLWEAAHGGPLDDLAERDIPPLYARVAALMAARPGHTFVKTHHALARVEGHWTVPWELVATAVYFVRDPRDVALSFASHFNDSVDDAIEAMGQRNLRLVKGKVFHECMDWSSNVNSWVDSGALVLKYEKMLRKPQPEFAKLLKHCGFLVQKKRLRRAIRDASFASLKRDESQDGFIEAPAHGNRFFRSGTSGQWRKKLSPEQIARLKADHGDTMRRMGYL